MTDALDDVLIPEIEPGIYQHYKTHNEYEVLGIALHSETLEPMVVYKPLYQTKVGYWIRPYKMFVEQVKVGDRAMPRFRKLSK